MTHPHDPIPEIATAVSAGRPLLVFSDFDGTLVPIDDTPFECYPTAEVRELLAGLNARPGWGVAIVSGRDLPDLRPRIGVEGLVYAGNHGLEIQGPGLDFREPTAVARSGELAVLVAELTEAIGGIPGAWVQNKILSASVHYRLTPTERIPQVQAIVERMTAPHRERFVLREGKAVLELRPAVDWNKGKAVTWLRDRLAPGPLCVFFGDDHTDEDAFVALPDGVTVRVGPEQTSAAKYRVDGPDNVVELLRRIAEIPAGE